MGYQGNSQSCDELMESIKANNYGTTYSSYTSEAISKVTFYEVMIDYQTYYFAIVCFKSEYSYNCSEYLYQVASNTKLNYSLNYLDSAGKAFWKYIQPYNKNLDCAPDFE
ncbi:hypothetical protein [Mesonia hippocampi]|nr:hypothetical protein [Mesonia hippocampi]